MGRLAREVLAQARRIISLYPEKRSALIPLCHLAQAQDGWLTPEAMEHIAELVGVTPAEVAGTASFYDMLHDKPVGRYLIGICTNIACMLEGGLELLEHAEERLGVAVGGTTEDGMFTLEEVECVGACDRAPCAAANWRYFGPFRPGDHASFDVLVEDLRSGNLEEEVPRHGVLSRTWRQRGLEVSPEQVRAERAEADLRRRRRKEQAEAGGGGQNG